MKKLTTLLTLTILASWASKKEMAPEKKNLFNIKNNFFHLKLQILKITCNFDAPTLSN